MESIPFGAPIAALFSSLPVQLPVQCVDVSMFAQSVQMLAERLQQLESRFQATEAENVMLNAKIAELSQQALVSQDQYTSLYESVQDGLMKIAQLQMSSYERAQAARDFATVNADIHALKDETARLEKAKIDANSQELEMRVIDTATAAANRLVSKFEKENKEWTMHQIGLEDDRMTKLMTAKITESEAKTDLRLLAMQASMDDVMHREITTRKDLDNIHTNLTTVLRVVAAKQDIQERHLELVEDDVGARIDLQRKRLDVFLEHCFGVSWSSVVGSIPVTSTLLPMEVRRTLTEAPSDDTFRRQQARHRRQMEQWREWKRLQNVNAKILLGLAEVNRRLESSEEQLDSVAQSRIQQRKSEDAAMEAKRREEFEAHTLLLREFMSVQAKKEVPSHSEDEPGHLHRMLPAVEVIDFILSTPLFAHVRTSLSSEVRQSLAVAREQFGYEYSNQLALVNKELRTKATFSGIEDTVREYTQRTLTTALASLEKRVEEIRGSYVATPLLHDILMSKADKLLVERKADDVTVKQTEDGLRAEMVQLHHKALETMQSVVNARMIELNRELNPLKAASRALAEKGNLGLLSPTDGGALGAVAVNSVNGSAAPILAGGGGVKGKCLSCQQLLPQDRQQESSGTTPAEKRLQLKQDSVHAQQMNSASDTVEQSATTQQCAAGDSVISIVAAAVSIPTMVTTKHEAKTQSASEPFRMKDWVDSIDKRFGAGPSISVPSVSMVPPQGSGVKRAPRPPSARERGK